MRIKPKEVRHSKERLSCSASKSHTATVGSSASPLDVTGRKRTQKKKGVRKAQRRQRNKNISEERAVKILELVGTNGLSASMSQSSKASDDVPTTSAQAKAVAATATTKSPQARFKKFTDSLQKSPQLAGKNLRKRLRKSFNSPAHRRIITRRLLRSIRRRQNSSSSHTASASLHTELRKKLSFGGKEFLTNNSKTSVPDHSKSKKISEQDTVTLEEGEILSDTNMSESTTKDNHTIANNVQKKPESDKGDGDESDNDDCICIEPHVEVITIDDSLELSSHTAVRETKKSSLITSTPQEKPKTSSAEPKSPTVSNFTENTNGQAIFYEDTSCLKWIETIRPNDNTVDYSPSFSTLRVGEREKRRRSQRLFNKSLSPVTVLAAEKCEDPTLVEDLTLLPQVIDLVTPVNSKSVCVKRNKKTCSLDDSVIFVSESSPKQPTYIPLEDDNVPNPICMPVPKTPKAKRPRESLFTKSEKKQLTEYNDNAYNPSVDKEKPAAGKRMVIIDGSNVAFGHGLSKEFSVKGLKICLDYFEKIGHEVKAVVPQFRLGRYKSTSPEELEALHRQGKIVFTPCKNLPGARSSSYDDRFVLQLACELDAAIVSNDNYRDLINENSAFKKIIENRVIGYTWCNDIFILPKDPYGKWGPPLHTILNRS